MAMFAGTGPVGERAGGLGRGLASRAAIFAAAGILLAAGVAMAFDYPKDVVLYEGTVAGQKVAITASARPFSKAAHTTTELRNAGTEAEPDWRPATVEGKAVIGADGMLPKDGWPQLSALTLWFGETKVAVPAEHLHHVFLPHLRPATIEKGYAHTLVTVSADAKAVLLSLGVGDGGGSGTYDLLITADGTVSTATIQRPEP